MCMPREIIFFQTFNFVLGPEKFLIWKSLIWNVSFTIKIELIVREEFFWVRKKMNALIRCLIRNWPPDRTCSDHVAGRSLITCLSYGDHVTEQALKSWLSMHWSCAGSRGGIPLWTTVMRKEARHRQMRDRASGVHPDVLEHLGCLHLP